MYEEKIRKSPELMASISELEGKNVGCWCNSTPCHGDILIKLFMEINSEQIKDQKMLTNKYLVVYNICKLVT